MRETVAYMCSMSYPPAFWVNYYSRLSKSLVRYTVTIYIVPISVQKFHFTVRGITSLYLAYKTHFLHVVHMHSHLLVQPPKPQGVLLVCEVNGMHVRASYIISDRHKLKGRKIKKWKKGKCYRSTFGKNSHTLCIEVCMFDFLTLDQLIKLTLFFHFILFYFFVFYICSTRHQIDFIQFMPYCGHCATKHS